MVTIFVKPLHLHLHRLQSNDVPFVEENDCNVKPINAHLASAGTYRGVCIDQTHREDISYEICTHYQCCMSWKLLLLYQPVLYHSAAD